jgi:hypothetical protein
VQSGATLTTGKSLSEPAAEDMSHVCECVWVLLLLKSTEHAQLETGI